ncbi:nicotinamide riboside transporter PnuC [Ferruginibacter albus]|uniref:nicotinamide riboside transporter PnuC n=1 Tax=Ferruginibacter albus TaxID=2875540 RepID=UPI001CC722F1|nr:nicotinamide riboside transporter PnuC [Ferruginibacter albus]UAY51977.1 nicotinamide riboside transporter PnuC [Ferruginibacter albus]
MSIQEIYTQFITDLKNTTWLEYIAVISGIVSVWFSRIENIWVYPSGLASTVIYIYISLKGSLIGEASVSVYYTIMSIYGWILWARKDKQEQYILHISSASKKEWIQHLLFFAAFYIVFFVSLTYLKTTFAPGAIPWADSFASATAFTGMWLMAKKKIESWYWWIATNCASIPLYFVKHYAFTSVLYLVLLIMAVFGLVEWIKREKQQYAIA